MKTMLDAITLGTLERIFEERAIKPISSMTKLIYINCLTGHFSKLPLEEKNSHGFELFIVEIRNYLQWEKSFIELFRANLIVINERMVIFENHWGQFIDKSVYTLVDENYSKNESKLAIDFKEQLLQSNSLNEIASMRHKWSKAHLSKAIEIFIQEQMVLENKYSDYHECVKHFMNWANVTAQKLDIKLDSVKSQGKIIGMR